MSSEFMETRLRWTAVTTSPNRTESCRWEWRVRDGYAVKYWFSKNLVSIPKAGDSPWSAEFDAKFYEPWGAKQELLTLSFNRWWETRGRDLFERGIPRVKLVTSSEEAVTVRIPTSINSAEVKKQVISLMTAQRGTKRLKRKAPLGFTGNIKLNTLQQYERYLEIELDPSNRGKTVEEKTEQLRKKHRDIAAKLSKQKETMAQAGIKYVKGKPLGKWLKARDPDSFDMYKDENGQLKKISEKEIRKGINAKKVSRWRLSGKLLLLNVAGGKFPGADYYGEGLEKKLQARLKEFGLQDIGQVVRNKGGGRKKEDLTLVRIARTKADREKQSLKSYGAGKNANPVGSADGQGS